MAGYYTFNEYLINEYGEKVGKLSLDAEMSCPNRDGKISKKGCVFCSDFGSGDFTLRQKSLKEQIDGQKLVAKNKWKVNKYIAHLQSYTNTYAPVDYLKRIYNQVLEDEEIVGLSIATRADCLDNEVLDLLEELSNRTNLWLEIGMQSIKEESISYINRGYSHEYLDSKLSELRKRNIKFLLHVIFGLPKETTKEMLQSINYVNKSRAWGIKIHSLYIQKNSPIYTDHKKGLIPELTREKYINLVADSISILDPNIVIHRITGDGDGDYLVSPLWTKDKLKVITDVKMLLESQNIYQGKHYIKNP